MKVKKIMVASPIFGVHASTLQCSMLSKITSRKRGRRGCCLSRMRRSWCCKHWTPPYFQSIVIEVGIGYTKLKDAIQGGKSWSRMVRWLWNRHMDLSLRVVQGL